MLHWRLIPSWADDPQIGNRMINARAETVPDKPSFRMAFKSRRCLILADGFYEWKKAGGGKQPYYIRMEDGSPFAFAGLWGRWENGREIRSCTIITTAANELVGEIHNRMPVILHPEDHDLWLNPDFDERVSHRPPEALLGQRDGGLPSQPVRKQPIERWFGLHRAGNVKNHRS